MNHCFELNLLNESVHQIHKASVNHLFMNQTDPVLKFNDAVNNSLKKEIVEYKFKGIVHQKMNFSWNIFFVQQKKIW